MNAIETRELTKRYRARIKREGLRGSMTALIHPEYREVEAVRGIDITVQSGEVTAFIGPNGAGKSTTIKMLCGILHPTSGELSVLGLSPIKDRNRLAQKIGTVFGQKSQLWLHLPAADSFTMLAAIYGVSNADRKVRVKELTEIFELGEFINTPVRKLSLGQRIRCEVAASLLHDPEILFLDEPTIGLDVVVKQSIRELILQRNRDRGTTVFLTSHDPGDIEHLCRRSVVIDRGEVVLDSPVEHLKSRYLNKKVIEVDFFDGARHNISLPGVMLEQDGTHAKYTVDTSQCEIGAVMETLVGCGVRDITVSNPPMEEIIAAIFRNGGAT